MAARRLLDKLKVFVDPPASSSRISEELFTRISSSEQADCSSIGFLFLPQHHLQSLPSSREDFLDADFCTEVRPWVASGFPALPSSRTSTGARKAGFLVPHGMQNLSSPMHRQLKMGFISSLKMHPSQRPWESSCFDFHRQRHGSSFSLHGHTQKRFMSTPKIKLKVDRLLDAHTQVDKLMRPIFKIKTLILRQEDHMIKVKYLDIKRKHLGLASKPVGMKGYLKVYPNMFELFSFPNKIQLWCKLTKTMVDLLEEEKRIYLQTEDQVVLKLRKLLMMSKDRRIKAGKIDFARKAFGFPEDFATRVAPAYPQYFRVVGSGPSPFIELVSWDDKIAVSELEKKAKEEALKAGYGDIETRGRPLEFKVTHSPGMFLKKKNLELLDKWQKLPYVSPYQDHSWVPIGTALSEKRIVAVLHELLSLTVEKRALMLVLGRFKEEFHLPESIGKLVNRFPGIFYLSLIGKTKTVFLRDCYKEDLHIENHARCGKPEAKIIEDHPLLRWRMKIAEMAREGPRLYAAQVQKANLGQKQSGEAQDDGSMYEDHEDEAGAVSDTDYVDSEGSELDSEAECDEDDMDESEKEEEKILENHRRPGKLKKEIW